VEEELEVDVGSEGVDLAVGIRRQRVGAITTAVAILPLVE
jgi:hypothetical protein